ncbi:MAG: tetratricopeptide repeat protein, partial [Clostridia bacterium]|nr:tetratricopeptide repeat protein [Clostridia bacterium]
MILETVIILAVIILILLLIFIIILKNKVITEKMKIMKLKMLVSFGKYDDAKKLALKIVDKYPQNHMAHRILGQLYEKEGNINVALDEFIRVAELRPDDYEIHFKVATLLQQTEKNEEAVIMLQDLLKMKPDYLDATLLLGNILYDEERFKEAVSVYISALRYNPTEYELYYNIGMSFTRLNDFQKAKEY